MIQDEFKVKVLIPEYGYKLTQAGEVEIENRIISDKVYLAVNDSAENWVEITIEEANAIIAEQEKIAQEREKLHNQDEI